MNRKIKKYNKKKQSKSKNKQFSFSPTAKLNKSKSLIKMMKLIFLKKFRLKKSAWTGITMF